jgi:hypothetical protein
VLYLFSLSDFCLDEVLCHARRRRGHNGCQLPSRLPPTQGRVSRRSWGEALADDTRTATPPRGAVENVVTSPAVADVRVGTPPRVAEVVGTSAGDVGATTSPTIIDADPIRTFSWWG